MKEQFTKAINSLCNDNKCRPPPPDMPLPSVTTKLFYTEAFGGNGGQNFEFESKGISPYLKVKTVKVCKSNIGINSIQFILTNGLGNLKTLKRQGGSGGDCSDMTLDDDDYINTAEVWTWPHIQLYRVVGIQLNTKNGKSTLWGLKETEYHVCINVLPNEREFGIFKLKG